MAERVDINSVLMQMRQVKDTILAQHQASQINAVNQSSTSASFQQVLQQQSSQAINGNSVNNTAVNGTANNASVTNANSPFNSLVQGLQDDIVDVQSRQKLQSLPLDDGLNNSAEAVVPDFKTMFGSAVDKVNEQQKTAAQLATRFEQGDPAIDLPEVMIALQKSSVSFQAMTQVRNKLVEAYKDIMNMPV